MTFLSKFGDGGRMILLSERMSEALFAVDLEELKQGLDGIPRVGKASGECTHADFAQKGEIRGERPTLSNPLAGFLMTVPAN